MSLGDLMKKEITEKRSYEEIRDAGDSIGHVRMEDVQTICSHFGMNGSSDENLMHIYKLGVPLNAIIGALEYGENRMNSYGNEPQITNIALGEKNRKYALVVLGNCGKSDGIVSAYPLNDFKQIKK